MFKVSPNKRTAVIAEPSDEEVLALVRSTKNQPLAATEVNRIVQALDLIRLPQLQKAFSAHTDAKIISLRLRYKRLMSIINENKDRQCLPQFDLFKVYDRCTIELKQIRQALELLINNILKNPKYHLRLDTVAMNHTVAGYAFSVEQSLQEKRLLIKIMEQVGHRQNLSSELLEISEGFSWLNDQHGLYKLSDLTLLMIMHFKNNFHKLLDKYNRCDNYVARSAIVAEMEPLALFITSLEQGIRRNPKFYKCDIDDIPEQQSLALVPRFSTGS